MIAVVVAFALTVAFGTIASAEKRASAPAFTSSKNTVVCAPDREMAKAILSIADEFRSSVAREWLGTELPTGAQHTIIHFTPTDDEDLGATWIRSNGDNLMWVRSSWLGGMGSKLRHTIHHEMAHVVLAERFGDEIPAWANEGIASLYDGQDRAQRRQRLLRHYLHHGSALVTPILERSAIAPRDEMAYALGHSLVQFLLERRTSQDTRAILLDFVQDGAEHGWEPALQHYYGLSISDLDREWRAWALRTLTRQRQQTQTLRRPVGPAPHTR